MISLSFCVNNNYIFSTINFNQNDIGTPDGHKSKIVRVAKCHFFYIVPKVRKFCAKKVTYFFFFIFLRISTI